jgi:hypothetical protein
MAPQRSTALRATADQVRPAAAAVTVWSDNSPSSSVTRSLSKNALTTEVEPVCCWHSRQWQLLTKIGSPSTR